MDPFGATTYATGIARQRAVAELYADTRQAEKLWLFARPFDHSAASTCRSDLKLDTEVDLGVYYVYA
jgi:hypothetical protein